MIATGRVFVTGGSSGLGAAVARHYAAAGWRTAIAGRDRMRLNKAASGFAGSAANIDVYPLDVRDSESLAAALAAFAPTAVVCCAAVLGRGDVWNGLTPSLFREVLEINVDGTLNACAAAMRLWRQAQSPGDIVNVSSLAGVRGMQRFEGFAAYAASKHAVIGLTEALALEARPFGIRINAIAPGAMLTPMSQALGLSPSTRPDAVVPTIAFLLDRSRSGPLNGSTLEIHCNDA